MCRFRARKLSIFIFIMILSWYVVVAIFIISGLLFYKEYLPAKIRFINIHDPNSQYYDYEKNFYEVDRVSLIWFYTGIPFSLLLTFWSTSSIRCRSDLRSNLFCRRMVVFPKLFCFEFERVICCGAVCKRIVGAKRFNYFKGFVRIVIFLFLGVYIGYVKNLTEYDKLEKAEMEEGNNQGNKN